MPTPRRDTIEVSLATAPKFFSALGPQAVRNPTTQSNGNPDFAFPKSSKSMLVVCDSDLEFSTVSLSASVTIPWRRRIRFQKKQLCASFVDFVTVHDSNMIGCGERSDPK